MKKKYNPLKKKFWFRLIGRKTSKLKELSEKEYNNDLINQEPKKAKAAFEKAWETRNFEIELYWKRATYFWALIIPAFGAYLAVVSSDYYVKRGSEIREELFLIICLGFLFSLAWHLTNKGSKSWQRHWEKHIDLLEDQFTGPLYKTVGEDKPTFSVSKINEITSGFLPVVWGLLGIMYFRANSLVLFCLDCTRYWILILSVIVVSYFVIKMIWGSGRGYFSKRSIKMHRRTTGYKKTTK